MWCTLMLAVVAIVAMPTQPQNPVMAIVVMPPIQGGACITMHQKWRARRDDPTMPPTGNATGCIWSLYVRWLQSSGVRVIPLPWDANSTVVDYILKRVNGVLLSGGELGDGVPAFHQYFALVQYIYNSVISMNAVGDPMVLWGTCEGFQFIGAAAAGTLAVISGGFKGMDPLMLPVNFTASAAHSRMYASAPSSIMSMMSTNNTTLNWHVMGLEPWAFQSGGLLYGKGLVPLGISSDTTGRQFVAVLEHTSAAIYASQFHPERPPYEFTNDAIGHNLQDLLVSSYHSYFLGDQLKKNKHSFNDAAEVNALTVDNYPLYNDGYGVEVYFV